MSGQATETLVVEFLALRGARKFLRRVAFADEREHIEAYDCSIRNYLRGAQMFPDETPSSQARL